MAWRIGPMGPRAVGLLTLLFVMIVGTAGAIVNAPASNQIAPPITDDDGRALTLRGFSTASNAKSSPDGLPELAAEDIDTEYGDMGTNFVRFLISWRAVEPEPGTIDQAYLDEVAERVDWYAERGYHVMLDMHQDLYSDQIIPGSGIGNGAPDWATFTDDKPINRQDQWELYYLEPGVIRAFDNFWNTTGDHPELREHYVAAWKAVAEKFNDHSAVIAYDLMNEPYGGTLQGPEFEAGPLSELYQDVSDAIRDVDTDSWLCLEPQAMGVNWGTATGLRKIDDARSGEQRIAYCPHLYPLPMDLGGSYSGTTGALARGSVDTWLKNTLQTSQALGDVPVILGEFGLDTNLPGALDYVGDVYEIAAKHGFGVAYWSRDDGSWGPYEDGQKRNLVQALARPYPRAVAGKLGQVTATSSRLEFDVTPDSAASEPTEVWLPPTFGNIAADDETVNGVDVQGAEVVDWDGKNRVLRLDIDSGARTVIIS